MGEDLVKAMSEIREDDAIRLVNEAVEKGVNPLSILEDCQEAMNIVGERYEKGEYYLPELMMSGEILQTISDIVKPIMQANNAAESTKKGKIVLGTVAGISMILAKISSVSCWMLTVLRCMTWEWTFLRKNSSKKLKK